MRYSPLQLGGSVSKAGLKGFMPLAGTNLRDFPLLLDTNNADTIENYWLHGSGRLVKRKGTTTNFDTSESTPIPTWKEYQNNNEILAYGQKVRAYNTVTGTFTNIKTDFSSANTYFDSLRAGDYFFVTNIVDGLWRISQTITYSVTQNTSGQNKFVLTGGSGTLAPSDVITGGTSGKTAVVVSTSGTLPGGLTVIVQTLSGSFTYNETITGGSLGASVSLGQINPLTVGAKITGQISGAKAIVLEDTGLGHTTGTITLGSISGTFQTGETILDDANASYPGRGLTTSVVGFAITNVSGAPKAKYIADLGDRIMLYNLNTDPAGWAYSNRDTGTNPPYSTWTTGSGVNEPGGGYFRNGVEATTAGTIGDIIFIGFTKGWYAFTITDLDSGGTLSKVDQTIQTSDLGIKKVKMTDVGLIACGTFGVKRLVSLGQPNVPYSEQWETLTEQLGEDYFTDVNFDDSDITYDERRGYIYISCAKGGGAVNNLILAIKADLVGTETDVKPGATSFFTGLNPYKFLNKDGEIYFTSSIDGVTYNLFDGENDNGDEIYCQYIQELNFGDFDSTFNLDEFKIYGELSSASSVSIYFDTFDENGYFEAGRRDYTWTATNSYTGGGGWGASPWGSSGWGAGGTASGLVYSKARMKTTLRNLTRVRVRIEASDTADHIIGVFSASASFIKPTRNNTLSAN